MHVYDHVEHRCEVARTIDPTRNLYNPPTWAAAGSQAVSEVIGVVLALHKDSSVSVELYQDRFTAAAAAAAAASLLAYRYCTISGCLNQTNQRFAQWYHHSHWPVFSSFQEWANTMARRPSSVRPSVNFCANRFFSQTNGPIATKLAHDGLQVSAHPQCAQGQGQRSRDTRTFLDCWNELLRHWRSGFALKSVLGSASMAWRSGFGTKLF